MAQLTNEADVLDVVADMNDRFLETILSFSDDAVLRNLTIAYEENRRARKVKLGFNAFALVSDVYHRENFHSDVIKAILDPSGAHGQGDLYLRLFLEFLRDHHGVALRVEDYEHAELERESGRIDLLIYDKNSKKAIIIENKINGAGDMNRQVVRYLEKVEDTWGYQCDAIIYLTLDFKMNPSTHGWNDKERARVRSLLCSITAFEDTPKDLYEGWLAPCHDATKDNEVAHVICQYRQLILKIGHNAMNKQMMEKYYEMMENVERYNAALLLNSMLSDLPVFRCQKVFDEAIRNPHPFHELFFYRPTLAVFKGLEIAGGSKLKIDVETASNDHTKISFSDEADPENGTLPKRILTEIGLIDAFVFTGGQWRARNFCYPAEEESFYGFFNDFLQRLRDYANASRPVSA